MGDSYPAEAFLDQPELLGPTLSPNGERVAFLWNKTGRRELYVATTAGNGDPTRVTDEDLRGWVHPADYCWGPEGDRLYIFRMPRDDPNSAEIVSMTLSGEWTPVLDADAYCFPLATTPDDRLLATLADDRGVGISDIKGENRSTLVGEDYAYFRQVRVGPDGEYVAFAAIPDGGDGVFTGYWTSMESDTPRKIDPPDADGSVFPVDWTPDGDRLFVYEHQPKNRYGLLNPRDGSVEWFGRSPTETPPASIENDDNAPIGFAPDGESVIAILNGELTIIDTDGDIEWGIGDVAGADVRGGRIVIITARGNEQAPQLLVIEWPDDTGTILLETSYGSVTPADEVAGEEYTYSPASTDEPASVLVHRPEEEPVPAVVHTYPGERPPDHLPRWNQYLVHRGYAVARPAIPGEKFTNAEHADLAAVGKWLCEREWVDGNRVAVFGHSSGGREVLMQLFTQDVWQAGLGRCGPADLFARDERNDGSAVMRRAMGPPEENERVWRDQNPLDNVEGLEKPLRVHHGVHDANVSVTQARALRDELRRAGYVEYVDFEYEELPDTGHLTADIGQNARELTRVVDFLNRRL